MIKTKRTYYYRGTPVDEITGMQYFDNKPEVAFLKCLMCDGNYSYIHPLALEESVPGELKKAIRKVCDHKFRTPFTDDNGVNYIICTVCDKSWEEGELCEWRKK